MKYTQLSKNNKVEVEFQIHKDFQEDAACMSYEILHWALRERCAICCNQNDCGIKKETCMAAGGNYPYQSVFWLIICPIDYNIRQYLPNSLIQCAKFNNIQTRLFPLTSDEQQNFLLTEMPIISKEYRKQSFEIKCI